MADEGNDATRHVVAGSPPAGGDRGAAALIAVLVVGATLRLAAVLLIGDVPKPHGDEGYYLAAAQSLAAGEGYPGAVRPPGFPAFMAGVFALWGASLTAVRIAQVVLSTLGIALVFDLVRRRFGVRPAFVSALLCAIHPDLVHYAHFLWAETLATTLLLLAVWCLDRFDQSAADAWLVPAGAVLGAAILTREMLLYLALVAVVWVWSRNRFDARAALRRACLLLAPVALIVAPWTLRNYVVLDRLVLISNTRWLPIAQGNLLPDDWSLDLRRSTRFGNRYRQIQDEIAREDLARRIALSSIRDEQPWWIVRKLQRNSYFLFAPKSQVWRFARRGWFVGAAHEAALRLFPVEACLYVALSLVGIAALWLVPGGRTKVLIVALVLLHLAIYTVANGNHRFRVPLQPFLLLYAGPLLYGVFPRFAQARLKWIGAALCLAGFVAVTATYVVREGLGVTLHARRAKRAAAGVVQPVAEPERDPPASHSEAWLQDQAARRAGRSGSARFARSRSADRSGRA